MHVGTFAVQKQPSADSISQGSRLATGMTSMPSRPSEPAEEDWRKPAGKAIAEQEKWATGPQLEGHLSSSSVESSCVFLFLFIRHVLEFRCSSIC